MTGWLVSLDDPRASDHDTVGVKSAWLARARARGLPVLPGRVVPTAAAVVALAAGQEALDSVGPARARPAAMRAPLDDRLRRELADMEPLGGRLVVRSSSELDDDGSWAGAFASYGDVEPGEVERAVQGCWASVFAPDALARFERTGRAPSEVRLGVLVQPHLRMDHGGWARIDDSDVEVAFVAGEPGPLLSGQVRGSRARMPLRAGGDHDLPAPFLAALRLVAARAHDELGAARLEWGVADGEVTILQLGASGGVSVASATAPDDGRFQGRRHVALAGVLATRRGPLADRLLTPWAAWLPSSPVASTSDPRSLLDRASRLSEEVAASVGLSVEDYRDVLASGEASVPDGQFDAGQAVAAAALIADADGLASTLAVRGAIPSPAAFWWQDEAWLVAAIHAIETDTAVPDPAPSARGTVDRWDALRFGVASAVGVRRAGLPASPGRATGRARWVSGPEDTTTLEPGDILVVEHPVPALAPFLWDRGGIVAASGSPGSHLCEVARSIHVPMVVGADIPERPGVIVALDGDAGEAWIWEP